MVGLPPAAGTSALLVARLHECLQLYLSQPSVGCSILTAKSSSVNVLVPGEGDEDMAELYVPEQFVSTVKNGQLVTEPVSHSGG